jgi:hypothetical protein
MMPDDGAVMGSRFGVLAHEDMADGLSTRLALKKVKKAVGCNAVSNHVQLDLAGHARWHWGGWTVGWAPHHQEKKVKKKKKR